MKAIVPALSRALTASAASLHAFPRFASALALLVPLAASAATFTWSGAGTGGDLGLVTAATNWTGGVMPVGDGLSIEDVVFGSPPSTAQSIFLPDGLTLHDLTFNSTTAYTFSGTPGTIAFTQTGDLLASGGGAVTLNNSVGLVLKSDGTDNSHTVHAGGGVYVTVNGVVSENGSAASLVKTGGGTLVLAGANTFTGKTAINNGYISIAADSGLGAAPGTVVADQLTLNGGALAASQSLTLNSNRGITVGASGGGLNVGTGNTVTYGGAITGSSTFDLQTGGALVLTGTNTFSGTFSNIGSILQIGNGGTTGSLAGNIANSGALIFNTGYAFDSSGIYSGNITGGGTLEKKGSGHTTLTGAVATGGTTVSAGFLNIGFGTTTGSLSGNVTLAGGQLQFVRSNAYTFSDNITGTGNIANYGATLTLSGANTYGGNTFLESFIEGTTATLVDGAAGAYSPNTTMRVAGGLTAAALQVNFNETIAGLNDYATNSSGSVTIASDKTLTINNGSANTFSGVISGQGALVKKNAGTLGLQGANLYTGGTTLNDGTLSLFGGGSLASTGDLNLAPTAGTTATFFLANSLSQTIGALNFSGSASTSFSVVSLGTGSTLTLGGNVSYDATNNPGPALIAGGTLALGGATRTFNIGDSTTTTSELTINSTIDGGSFGIAKSGAGTLVLTKANTFTGGVALSAGTLRVTNAGALGTSGTPAVSGGTLEFANDLGTTFTASNASVTGNAIFTADRATAGAGVTHQLGTLSINGSTLEISRGSLITSGTGGLSFGTTTLTGNATFNVDANATLGLAAVGESGGARKLTKSGLGGLTLNAVNTYTGGTTISDGVVIIGVANALPSTGLLTVAKGTLSLGSFNNAIGALTLGGVTAAAQVTGSGRLDLGGNVTFDATNNPNAATISAGLGLNADRTFTVGNSNAAVNDLTISGAIIDNGTGSTARKLTKAGAGTLSLQGANTYTGGTTINAGTLSLDLAGSLASTGALNLAPSSSTTATFILGSEKNQTIGALNFSGGNSTSVSNVTIGAASVLTLGGDVTYSTSGNLGTATISGGGSLALGASRTFTVAASGSASTELSIGSAISGATFGLTKAGAGTLLLTGANTYSGGTTVSAGTLKLSGSGTLGATSGNLTVSGGTLDIGSVSPTVAAVSLTGGTITGSTGTLTGSSYDAQAGTVSASLGGTAVLTKSGSGTVVLSGANNTYSGGTALNAGVLTVTDNTGLGSGALTVAGGQLQFQNNANTTFTGTDMTITGNATLTADRATSSSLSSVTHDLDELSIGANTLSVTRGSHLTGADNTGTLTFGYVVLTGNPTLNVGTNAGLTLGDFGSDSSAGHSITKEGAGTLTLDGRFAGGLTANAGTVALTNSNARGSAIWTFNNATLEVGFAAPTEDDAVFQGNSAVQTTFTGQSSLSARTQFAINGGTQSFQDKSVLTASGDHVITGGVQEFVTTANPIPTPASETPFSTTLTAMNDTDIGDNVLPNTARLTVDRFSSDTTIMGGTQIFSGYSSLQANHKGAIAGTTTSSFQEFHDNAHLRASKDSAVNGGTQTFFDNSFLWAKTTDGKAAVTNGRQRFHDCSLLIADTANAVTGGTQTFYDRSGLLANVTGSIAGTSGLTLHLWDDSFVQVNAINALSSNTAIIFQGSVSSAADSDRPAGYSIQSESTGGLILMQNTTVGALTSSDGAGRITLNSSTLTTTVGSEPSTASYSGVITGSSSSKLIKNGSGTLELSGSNLDFNGTMQVDMGALRFSGSFGTGSTTVINSGGSFSGTGTLGALNVAGGSFSPGNPVGALTAGATTFGGSGHYFFDITDATGGAGTGWDLLTVSTLAITATSAHPFAIELKSFSPESSLALNFNSSLSYSFAIVNATSITGFDPSVFSLVTSGFQNSLNGGSFSLSTVTNAGNTQLLLNFTPVPEPSTWALLLSGLGVLALGARRRLRRR